MAVLVALVKWTNNSDYHASRRLQALANAGVGNGLLVTTNQLALGWWFVEVTRLGGDPFYILVEVTTNTVIDTSGTKKIWIEIGQSYIDETLPIPGDRTAVATIQTGASYPASGSYIKLASTSSGVITDERVFISLNTLVNLRKGRTAHRLFYTDSSGNEVELAFGTTSQVLTANGVSVAPSRQSPSVNITALTEDTAPDHANDFLLDYDTSAGVNKKVKFNSFKASDAEMNTGTNVDKYITPKHIWDIRKVAVLQNTRALNAATGTQVIAHGLWVIPKWIEAYANHRDGSVNSADTVAMSTWRSNLTTHWCTYKGFAGDAGTWDKIDVGNAANLIRIRNTNSATSNHAQTQVCTVTADATNITLSWTYTVTGSSNLSSNLQFTLLVHG